MSAGSDGSQSDSSSESAARPSRERQHIAHREAFPSWFRLTVASVLLALFSISYIKDMTDIHYEVPAPTYGLVLLIVGAIFGTEAVKGMRR
jgi:hypothetical protein